MNVKEFREKRKAEEVADELLQDMLIRHVLTAPFNLESLKGKVNVKFLLSVLKQRGFEANIEHHNQGRFSRETLIIRVPDE